MSNLVYDPPLQVDPQVALKLLTVSLTHTTGWPDGSNGNNQFGAAQFFDIVTWTGDGTGTVDVPTALDLTDGGMVWAKSISNSDEHTIYYMTSNGATVYDFGLNNVTANATGNATFGNGTFTLDASKNVSGRTYIAYVFKRDDVNFSMVDYTGDAVQGRTVAHPLGSTPGFVFTNPKTGTKFNYVQQIDRGGEVAFRLESSVAENDNNVYWDDTNANDTEVTLGNFSFINGSGIGYTMFLFANNSLISSGEYTGNGAPGNTVPTGLETSWILSKAVNSADWVVLDTVSTGDDDWAGNDPAFIVNSGGAQSATTDYYSGDTSTELTLSGGQLNNAATDFIFLAISKDALPSGSPQSEGYTLRVASGVVGSDLTDFVMRVDLSGMPAAFWSDVDVDGGNIRVYDAGDVQLPMDLVYIDKPANEGELFIRVDILSGSDNDFTLKLDGGGVIAAGGPLGQESVWQDYTVVAAFADLINRVDSSPLTVTGTPGTSLPNWFNADDAAHIVVPNLTQDTTHTLGASFRLDTISGGNQVCVSWGDSNSDRASIAADRSSGGIDLWDTSNSWISGGVSPAVDTTYRAVSRYNGTTARHLTVNGTTTATDLTITAKPSSATPDLYIGVEDGTLSERLHGKVNYVYLRGDVLSDDWLAAEYDSWHTSSFYSLV